jgi:hypothetical protein
MVDNHKGTTMGSSSCEWVRQWLPLLVEDIEEPHGDGDDLGFENRHRIALHLSECKPCREHHANLAAALSLLATVAAESPVEPSDSVWPSLEQRIQRHHGQSQSEWLQWLRGFCPSRIRVAAARLNQGFCQIRTEIPLQSVWLRDSLHEFLEVRFTALSSRFEISLNPPLRSTLSRVGYSFAAAFLAAVLVMSVVHRLQVQAEALIAANAAPMMSSYPPLGELEDEPEVADAVVDTHSYSSDTLAQIDRVQTAEVSASTTAQSPNHGAKPPVGITTPRYDFDLEQGIPMPPDSRGSKPAY